MRLSNILSRPLLSQFIPFVAILLCLPSLFTGLMGDDYFFYALFDGYQGLKPITDISLFNLFSFSNGDPERFAQMQQLGLLPWWTVSDFKYLFFRPLSELSHYIDFRLWPQSSIMMHVHNLLWFFAALWILRALYQKWFDTKYGFAALALLLFAFDASHGVTVSWIANRNALIAAVFSLLALMFFMRWREQDKNAHFVLAMVFYSLGLLSAEIALSISAYFFAYILFLDRKSLASGLMALMPFALLSVLWLLFYKYHGFGASGVPSFYLDPFANPYLFLQELTERLPAMMMSEWGLIPAELGQDPAISKGVLIQAQIALALLLLLWVPLMKQDRLLRFFVLASIVSALPVCSALPQDRNLFFIGFAGSGAVARYCQLVWANKADWPRFRRMLHQSAVVVLLVLHLVLATLLLPVMTYAPAIFNASAIAAVKDAPSLEGKHVFFLNTPMPTSGYFTPMRYYFKKDLPESAQAMSFAIDSHWELVDERHLYLHIPKGLTTGEGRLVRDVRRSPFEESQAFSLPEVDITPVQFEGAEVTKVLLSFKQPLTSDQYVFVTWNKGKIRYLTGAGL